jgi:hypothetical protein
MIPEQHSRYSQYAMEWTVLDSNPCGGEILRMRPADAEAHFKCVPLLFLWVKVAFVRH